MSFILDALRKSESERRQDEGPSITRIPNAVQQRGVPTWAVATIAVLAVGVVALTGAWIYSLSGGGDVASGALRASPDEPTAVAAPGAAYAAGTPAGSPSARSESATRVEQLALPRPSSAPRAAYADTALGSAAVEAAPSASTTAASGTSTTAASGAPSAAASGASALAAAARAAADDGGRSSTAGGSTGTSARPASLPQIDAMLASYAVQAPGLGLPELRLELLAYDDDPSLRFVFINGRRYVQGDTLTEGPRVIGINSRGAVLLAGDRQLQLEQR